MNKRKLKIVMIVVLVVTILTVVIYDRYKYERVYTDIVDGERVYYEEIEVEINGIEFQGFYKLGFLKNPSSVIYYPYNENESYIVNDELEIITTYKTSDADRAGTTIEDAVINSAIRKLIYQYFSSEFSELNGYFEDNYNSVWENKKVYEEIVNITIHPNVNKYIQIGNYIYNDCLNDDEVLLIIEAMKNNVLDINENQDLYDLIHNKMYDLLSYESEVSNGSLITAVGHYNFIEVEEGKDIIPLVYEAYVVNENEDREVEVRNELTDRFEERCLEEFGEYHQIYCSFRYLEPFRKRWVWWLN